MLQDWTPQAATAAATIPWGILTFNEIESIFIEMDSILLDVRILHGMVAAAVAACGVQSSLATF